MNSDGVSGLSDVEALAILNKLVLQITGGEARALLELIMTEYEGIKKVELSEGV